MSAEEQYAIKPDANIFEFFQHLFKAEFMPHGHCYYWRPEILWVQVISDMTIALAYYSIPLILIFFVIRRKNVPFNFLFFMFGAFIFLCGTTHLISIMMVWNPAYRFDAFVKALTALVSLATAFAMIPIMPKAVNFPRMESLIRQLSDKTQELGEVNAELERFNKLTMGREGRILELKKEVNALCKEMGRSPFYDI